MENEQERGQTPQNSEDQDPHEAVDRLEEALDDYAEAQEDYLKWVNRTRFFIGIGIGYVIGLVMCYAL